MKKLIGSLALGLALAGGAIAACSNDASTDGNEDAAPKTTLNMPLLTTVGGQTYQVQGDVTVQRTDTDPDGPLIEVAGFSASLAETITVEVEPGTYNVHIDNWTITNQNGVEICVDDDATDECELLADTLLTIVTANTTNTVTFQFTIDGIPGVVNPPVDGGVCSGHGCYCPDGNCCAGDLDHDGFINCLECPQATFVGDRTLCPDTDEDGTPDYLDENSDCDAIDDCDEGTLVGSSFVLSNELRIDDVSCVQDTGNIDIDVDIDVLDGGV